MGLNDIKGVEKFMEKKGKSFVTHDVNLVQKAAKLLRFIAVPLRFFILLEGFF